MEVYAATKNAGKLRELQAIFAGHGWTVRDDPQYADVVEGERSYQENAALKARALFAQLSRRGIRANVVGDDSGLEVEALDGRPGVLSARYGGPDATWPQRRQMLLAELERAGENRAAAFVCALHFISADGWEAAVIARLRGAIARGERGDAGFSYDSIFHYEPLGATFGELSEERKNAISHRALAARDLIRATEAAGTVRRKVRPDGT